MSSIPLNIDFQQILLHLFNVVILFAILYFLIYKPVKNYMEKRHQEYQDMEDAAADKLAQAQKMEEEYQAKLAGAQDEIRSMKSDAEQAADLMAAETKQQAQEQAQQILSAAKAQAENEREKILAKAGDQVAEMATQAASKAIFENSSEAFDSFLNAAEGQD